MPERRTRSTANRCRSAARCAHRRTSSARRSRCPRWSPAIWSRRNPAAFDKFFKEIYQVGIPGVRKYCSPLQAFFWLIKDNKIDELNSIIVEHSLDKLLYSSWDFNEEISIVDLDLTEKQVKEIIASIDKEIIWYAKFQKNPKDIIILCYNKNQNAIPLKYRGIIENDNYFKKAQIYFDRDIKRWTGYEIIIERLNSPELLNFYLKINIHYYHKIPCYHRDPRTVIKEKYGDCDDLAYFGKVILSKAGYDVFGRIVGNIRSEFHIGLGVRLDDGSYLLAVNFKGQDNDMSGPYKTLLELDRALGYGPSYNGRGSFSFTWFGFFR